MMFKTIGILTVIFLFVVFLPEMLETADKCLGNA
jgi:hypothetical protein